MRHGEWLSGVVYPRVHPEDGRRDDRERFEK
jgi:hypothetical protein